MTALDQFMHAYEFNEVHSVTIHASPAIAYAALKQVTVSEMSPLVTWLLNVRALPDRLSGHNQMQLATNEPLLEAMLRAGFVALTEVPGREVVIGQIGQPWKIVGGAVARINSAEAFLRFDKPDYARIAANLIVLPSDAPGQVKCVTETRVHIPDPAARKQFAMYWRVISTGSALIRRMWLSAIKQRAERSALLQSAS